MADPPKRQLHEQLYMADPRKRQLQTFGLQMLDADPPIDEAASSLDEVREAVAEGWEGNRGERYQCEVFKTLMLMCHYCGRDLPVLWN